GAGRGEVWTQGIHVQDAESARGKEGVHVEPFLSHRHHLGDSVEIALSGVAVFLLKKIVAIFSQSRVLRVSGNRQDFALDLNSQIPKGTVQPDGCAVSVFGIDVTLPKVRRFENVHIRVHDLESVLRHLALLALSLWFLALLLRLRKKLKVLFNFG